MPVSSTATSTPVPSWPAAHASGAPISGTLWSRVTLTLRSSHTFDRPEPSAVRVPRTLFQNEPACPFVTRSAAPCTAARSRVGVLAGSASAAFATVAGALVRAYWAITGT